MPEKKVLNQAYYASHGKNVQMKRVIKRIEDGKKVRPVTLIKYGLWDAKKKKIVIPQLYKTPVLNFKDLSEAPPKSIDVVRQAPPKEIIYHNPDEVCTGTDVINFLKSPEAMLKPDGHKRGLGTLNGYRKIPEDVATINNKIFNPSENIARDLNDAPKMIAGYKKMYNNNGTIGKKIGAILYLTQNCPKLITGVHRDAIDIYNKEYQSLKGIHGATLEAKRKSTEIYDWDTLCAVIRHKYGKNSVQNLIMCLYTEIIGRDDFSLPIVRNLSQAKADENYIYLNFETHQAVVHLAKYKTADVYGKQNNQLSPATCEVLFEVIKPDQDKLFQPKKLSNTITTMFNKTGLDDNIGVRYFRRSRVSSELLKLNPNAPNYGEKRQALAELAMHSVGTQEKYTYKFKPCPDIAGLKSVPVKQINSRVMKDFENEITTIRSRRERVIKSPEIFTVAEPIIKRKVATKEFIDYSGRRVSKKFPDKKIYEGTVEKQYRKKGALLWSVKFDDGDKRDFTAGALEKVLKK